MKSDAKLTGCAFSISSNTTTLYGLLLTLSVNCPPLIRQHLSLLIKKRLTLHIQQTQQWRQSTGKPYVYHETPTCSIVSMPSSHRQIRIQLEFSSIHSFPLLLVRGRGMRLVGGMATGGRLGRVGRHWLLI